MNGHRSLTTLRAPLLAVAAALLSACVSHSPRVGSPVPAVQASGVDVQRDITYTPADWPQPLQGDLYRPQGADGPGPAVLLVHGGGWERRTRADTADLAQRIARRGYVVFNISHRFAPRYTFPAQIHDLAAAVRWLRQNADARGIDPQRIGAWGYSSGAHLVGLLGTLSPGDAHFPGDASRLNALVLGGTPADLRKYEGGTLVPQFLGATQAENAAVYAQASPTVQVSGDDPPTVLYHGGLDLLVSDDHAREMKAALDAAGVPAELYIARFREHVTMFTAGGGAERAGLAFLDRVLRQP